MDNKIEIHPSITAQAMYGENGRAALPLDCFVKDRSKCVNKEHLGVPIVIALIPTTSHHRTHCYNDMGNFMSEEVIDIGEPIEPKYKEIETIVPEIYDTLLNNVLLESMREDTDSDTDTDSDSDKEYETKKKHSNKKNKTHKKIKPNNKT
jgi:hypothetical protein